MWFACQVTNSRIETVFNTFNIFFLRNWLDPSDLVKFFRAILTETEILRDLSVVTICFAKTASPMKSSGNENAFALMQRRVIYMKTHVPFIVLVT